MCKRKSPISFKAYDQVNRNLSIEKGDLTYLSIKGCKKCGSHIRYVNSYACHPCELRKQREHYQRPQNKPKQKEHRLKKYGITGAQYDNMLIEQHGRCLICGIQQIDYDRSFAVDHDHRSGSVRGLLCGKCNTSLHGIEYFLDNDHQVSGKPLFHHAIAYVKKSSLDDLEKLKGKKWH